MDSIFCHREGGQSGQGARFQPPVLESWRKTMSIPLREYHPILSEDKALCAFQMYSLIVGSIIENFTKIKSFFTKNIATLRGRKCLRCDDC